MVLLPGWVLYCTSANVPTQKRRKSGKPAQTTQPSKPSHWPRPNYGPDPKDLRGARAGYIIRVLWTPHRHHFPVFLQSKTNKHITNHYPITNTYFLHVSPKTIPTIKMKGECGCSGASSCKCPGNPCHLWLSYHPYHPAAPTFLPVLSGSPLHNTDFSSQATAAPPAAAPRAANKPMHLMLLRTTFPFHRSFFA